LERQTGRFQTAAAGHLRGGSNAPLDKDVFLHPPDGAGDVDPVQDKTTRSRLRQALLEPFSVPFEPEVYSPFRDVADVDLQKISLSAVENGSFPKRRAAE
jgi:hypothetical protein